MLDFADREIGKLIYRHEDLVDFVSRNLWYFTFEVTPAGIPFSQIDSDYVLDLNERPSTYPYFIVVHYDDERKVMRIAYVKPEDVTEPTAYEKHCNALYNSQTMVPWLTRLKEQAQSGKREVTFQDVDDNPNDNHYNLNNKQADWLRTQGFHVDWDKYPRQWTVKDLI